MTHFSPQHTVVLAATPPPWLVGSNPHHTPGIRTPPRRRPSIPFGVDGVGAPPVSRLSPRGGGGFFPGGEGGGRLVSRESVASEVRGVRVPVREGRGGCWPPQWRAAGMGSRPSSTFLKCTAPPGPAPRSPGRNETRGKADGGATGPETTITLILTMSLTHTGGMLPQPPPQPPPPAPHLVCSPSSVLFPRRLTHPLI